MEKSEVKENGELSVKSVDSRAFFSCLDNPHGLEQEVSRHLSSQPGLKFASLVVHRTVNGVCLEGRLETLCDNNDVTQLALEVSGVNDVLNRLMQCPADDNC